MTIELCDCSPAQRLALTRALMLGAIGRYESALANCRAIVDAAPDRGYRYAEDVETDEQRGEWEAWKSLRSEANFDFDAAEMALAGRIEGLYDVLAAERGGSGEVVNKPESGEIAIRHGGTTYVLAYATAHHEPETNIIAIVRDPHILSLG